MIIKSILIGDSEVGKTHFINKILKRKTYRYIPTIGIDYAVYKYRSSKLCIWDTSGDARFYPIIEKFLFNAPVLICIYKDFKSYTYLNKLLKKIDLKSVEKIFFINVGKVDGIFDFENTRLYYYNCDLDDYNSCVRCMKMIINTCSKKKLDVIKKREWCGFWV